MDEQKTVNIKHVNYNHNEYTASKTKPFSHICCRFGLVTLNFVSCFIALYAYLNASNQSLLQFIERIFWVVAEQLQKLWRHFPE